ncbi:hypothetical protein N0A02_32860 (plasmid) [Paraburkholderia acidicola]|uniref:EF-hand domain-containing protein n=1 Tax=Paraburkholderia acidicola TaxID=1912599 RepID=A0ABV1LY52_9BURK
MKNGRTLAVLLIGSLAGPCSAWSAHEPYAAFSQERARGAGLVKVGERLVRPPIALGNPSSDEERHTPAEINNEIEVDLKRRFAQAAEPSGQVMTKAGARRAAWGWAVDHFDEIDQQKKGAVRYEDIARFLSRNPIVSFSN